MALLESIAFDRFRKTWNELTQTQKDAVTRRFWYMVVAPVMHVGWWGI